MSDSINQWIVQSVLIVIVVICAVNAQPPDISRGYSIPVIDLTSQSERQIIIDREAGQYPGHPTTVLLEDRKTLLAVYPKGHGTNASGWNADCAYPGLELLRDDTFVLTTYGHWIAGEMPFIVMLRLKLKELDALNPNRKQ
jgi:hypothetical protein